MQESEKMLDFFKYNAAANAIDLVEAEKRLETLHDRRAKISERSTFGLLALNGASAVAAFSTLQAAPASLKSLAISPTMVAFSLSAFLLGMILAVIGVWAETTHLIETTGRQFARTNALRNISKTLSDNVHTEAVERLGQEIEQLQSVPPTDFAFSRTHLMLQNFSGGAWLCGVGYALWLIGKQIEWCG